jgi:hypothetical protein
MTVLHIRVVRSFQELLRSVCTTCIFPRPNRQSRSRGHILITTITARAASAVAALALFSFSAFAAGPPLFPQPIHLTRAVDDPSGKTTVVDEYCRGNTIISIYGEHTVVADYEKQTVTEIDRATGTYSVTPFADLAKIAPPPPRSAKTADETFTYRTVGPRAGHAGAEYYEAEAKIAGTPIRKVETAVDRSVALSRDAAEVLAGAAYPRARSDESEIVLRASAPDAGVRRAQSNAAGAAVAQSYGLAVEQDVTYQFEGRTVVIKNRITHVGHEEPLPALTAIPSGARLVESAAIQARKALDEADHLPSSPAHK